MWHASSASQLLLTERFVVFHSAQVMLMIGSSISVEGAIGSQAVCEQREGWEGPAQAAAKSAQAVCRLSEQLRLPIVRV